MVADYKIFQSPLKWMTMLYPSHWETMIVEEIPAFFDPEGGGALQIFSFENLEKKFDLDEEMERYLSIHGMGGKSVEIISLTNEEEYDIRAAEFSLNDRFWIIFMLSNKINRMILATYNCDEIIDEMTAEYIFNAISSIKIGTA